MYVPPTSLAYWPAGLQGRPRDSHNKCGGIVRQESRQQGRQAATHTRHEHTSHIPVVLAHHEEHDVADTATLPRGQAVHAAAAADKMQGRCMRNSACPCTQHVAHSAGGTDKQADRGSHAPVVGATVLTPQSVHEVAPPVTGSEGSGV